MCQNRRVTTQFLAQFFSDYERRFMSDSTFCKLSAEKYEELVASLAEEIVAAVEGDEDHSVGCGSKNRVEGASGHEHQIDVSVNGPDYLYLAECKCWNSKVPVEMVLAFLGRVVDIRELPTIRRMIPTVVTTMGFQSGCQKIADQHGITLDVVRNEREFAMKYRDLIRTGTADGIVFGDSPSAT